MRINSAALVIIMSLILGGLAQAKAIESKASQSLSSILDSMPNDVKARYSARHPKETLEFFGIKPGMTVVEALPGGGWYSKILLPYLGAGGQLIGADYAVDMYPKFGFFDEKTLNAKKTWVKSWTGKAESWRSPSSAKVDAFQFGSMPSSVKNKADAVLFIRALHNLVRFENDGAYLTKALKDARAVLKPGGIIGVVQHMAPESASDQWADGSSGYIKKSRLVALMKKAGFELTSSSELNINPKDNPTEKDSVWRLSPTFYTSRDNPKLKEKYKAIGESTRMTLIFKKI